ncbi:MAG: hypothetical protein F6K14_20960 [Symploca sp. SIO2C1]|nr:hypothetical protein [Symploca sp. SIO2C1]
MPEGNNFINAQFAGGYTEKGDVYTGEVNYNNNYPSDKNLADAAEEIQQLLKKLEQNNPTNTLSEREKVIQQKIQEIEKNADPTLKQRLVGALQAGSVETLKQMVEHPLIHILFETVKGGTNPN